MCNLNCWGYFLLSFKQNMRLYNTRYADNLKFLDLINFLLITDGKGLNNPIQEPFVLIDSKIK